MNKPPKYSAYSGNDNGLVAKVCIGAPHPERAAQLEKLREQFPNMAFEEVPTGPLTRSFAPAKPASSGDPAVDAVVGAANTATPSRGCNGTTIKAMPKP